jgi:hypothetical protein
MGKMGVEPRGWWAAGLQEFSKRGPLNGGLGLEARAGLVLAPIKDDRTHLGAANGNDGLRKRSAGAAAEMLSLNGHWNGGQHAESTPRAKDYFPDDRLRFRETAGGRKRLSRGRRPASVRA